MSLINMDGALIQAYLNMSLGLPTEMPNKQFTIPNFGDWARLTLLNAGSEPATTGVGGFDEHLGIMQLDFFTQPGTGRAGLTVYLQAVRNQFVAGKRFERNGQGVHIDSCSRSQFKEVDGWMRATIEVNWNARTIRPGV